MIASFKLEMEPESKIIKNNGLQANGPIQKIIDSEVIRRIEPYTPKREGILIASGPMHTKIGSGEVIQETPYARRLYYNRHYNFWGAPRRGAFWFERMKADHKDDILKLAKEKGAK